MKNKFSMAFSLAVIMAMLLTSLALADTVTSDVVLATSSNETFIDLGNVAPGQVINSATSFQLVCSGNNHADQGNTVFVQYFSATVPAGSLTASDTTIGPIPAAWTDDASGPGNCPSPTPVLADNGNSTVTITAPMATGQYDYAVTYKVCQSNTAGLCGGIDPNDVSGAVPAVTFRLHVVAADTTAPTASPTQSPAANGAGWNNTDVTVSWNWADNAGGSGIDSANCTTSSLSSGEGELTLNATCDDLDGNTGSASYSVKVDKTKPVITGSRSPLANGLGWNNTDVAVSFTCSDTGGSGIDTNTVAGATLTGEGAGQSVTNTGTCTDNAGNTADSATVSGINIDKTKPVITGSRLPLANSNGWNNTDVTVSFSCADALSGIDTNTVAGATLSSEGSGQSVPNTGSCTDKAGNIADSATVSGINIDKTKPVIAGSASPAANGFGWNNTDVEVSFSCTDALSTVNTNTVAGATLTSEGAGQSVTNTGSCTDKAGNTADSATVNGINIDKTAPTVALVGGPSNSGTYYFNFVPAAPTCTASDGLSGLDGSCSVDGYSNAIGSHTVTASATDKAGNSASASAAYAVLAWKLNGFYQPVDMNGVYNIVKGGSTVPLKFEVLAGATELTATSVVQSFVQTKIACDGSLPTDEVEVVTTGGTSLRYDTTGGQFIQNWQTPKLPGTCYRVTMTTDDGSSLVAFFKLK